LPSIQIFLSPHLLPLTSLASSAPYQTDHKALQTTHMLAKEINFHTGRVINGMEGIEQYCFSLYIQTLYNIIFYSQ